MKKLLLILVIVIIAFVSINFVFIKKLNENKMAAVVENTINIEKKNIDSKSNNLLEMERIVVILPSEKEDVKEEIQPEDLSEEENIQNETENEESIQKPAQGNPNNSISNKKYYIKVNYSANVVTVYSQDENGEYTVPVKAMVCSTGTATPTSGVYGTKLKWEWLKMFGNVYGYYTTQIVGNILFHSVPYLEKGNPGSLEYWEYDKLGTSCSAGCIRLTVADAKWIYNNVEQGTLVEFYSSSDSGPLRKTSSTKNIE